MDKIYSRKRFKFPKFQMMKLNNNRGANNNKKSKKIFTFFIIICMLFFILIQVANSLTPIFDTLCEVRAKGIATEIINNCVKNTIQNVEYEDLINLKTDANGNMSMIKADTMKMNKLSYSISSSIQAELNNLDKTTIGIPIGSLIGSKFLSGTGPSIKVKLVPVGNVESEFKTEFTASGINQTVHKVFLEVKCNVSILTPFRNTKSEVTTQIVVAETVIVGNVPSSYYNLDGLDRSDTLKLIE